MTKHIRVEFKVAGSIPNQGRQQCSGGEEHSHAPSFAMDVKPWVISAPQVCKVIRSPTLRCCSHEKRPQKTLFFTEQTSTSVANSLSTEKQQLVISALVDYGLRQSCVSAGDSRRDGWLQLLAGGPCFRIIAAILVCNCKVGCRCAAPQEAGTFRGPSFAYLFPLSL